MYELEKLDSCQEKHAIVEAQGEICSWCMSRENSTHVKMNLLQLKHRAKHAHAYELEKPNCVERNPLSRGVG
ncbi:hypothetical protein GW17_00042661 [Ensete ventricosum]|nr:hypothetical protein GW17_00042661 [Ensete ventricosum]RZS05240.1 hypothetical protein BHM03_00035718 [Ensete ventricosum]